MILIENPPFSPERAFFAVFLSWFVAQFLKVLLGGAAKKKFDVRWLFDTGGMPSAHSATVASLAASVGLYYGFNTIPFLMALIICLITMFDAAGVRRHLGRQGKILNEVLDEFYAKGAVPEKRLKELLGHTPFEVIAGAFLGIIIAILLCG
ncbi:MAG TPA: divergent PAP2 family protein [Candidatus Omnitrophota bacterium]|nr:divergent PAP2 family protein [Candidatus Omnitrophota bacterium]HPS36533.1 divergent PAP2 family protein [Candidatus Omnitrophota bacterium]